MQQQDLLTADVTPPRCDPRAPKAARARLCRQARTIYALLEAGPVTLGTLRAICAKHTNRISEIRAYLKGSGRTVKCIAHNQATGATVYAIVADE